MRNGVAIRAFSYFFFALFMVCITGCGTHDSFGPPASTSAGDGGPGAPGGSAGPSSKPAAPPFAPVAAGSTGPLVVSPSDIVVDVDSNGAMKPVSFVAQRGGVPVDATWSFDREEVARIDSASGALKASAKLGGKGVVSARHGSLVATAKVTVRLHRSENGGVQSTAGGAGGAGGVGGEGVGPPVNDNTRKVLDSAPAADASIHWLYPYDQTVWPRGLLAPLLQWDAGGKSIDAVAIHIEESTFVYDGYFSKGGTPLVHHPIPQAAWHAATYSNDGDDLQISLVFSINGKAVGPIRQKWHIAKTTLTGTVYYNSYGTQLAHNETDRGVTFGGATLAIKAGAESPVLVAGRNGDKKDCRVCHSVSADGSTMITQQGNFQNTYDLTSAYDLRQSNRENTPTTGRRNFTWATLSPDGKYLFSDTRSGGGQSGLFELPSWKEVTTTGYPSGLGGATPAFSPDGKHIAFNLFDGQGSDRRTLSVIEFDPATRSFRNFVKLFISIDGPTVWPSFVPTSEAIIFQVQSGLARDLGETRASCEGPLNRNGCLDVGARGALWIIDRATKKAISLDRLNGVGYLPPHPSAALGEADSDATLNYEPTVNPVAGGGYAWVVFTSRRLYGNVATINPFWSDPRYHDLSKTPTTKKLWVAAIDLSAPPGVDPSHPAFYLPGQELLAGNSRGYWVVDPCRSDGTSCVTGDECCGGYCRPEGDAGGAVCTAKSPECAQEYEKCVTSADCCVGGAVLACVNGRCTEASPH